jgi:ribosomal protein L19
MQYALDHGEKTPTPTRGTVIGRRRRGLDSKFTILNVSSGIPKQQRQRGRSVSRQIKMP